MLLREPGITDPYYHKVEEVVIGGMIENQMALMVNETRYLLNDEKIPLEEHPVTRTSWGEWKKDHPDTDIYIGMMFDPTITDDARPPRTTSVGQD